MKITKGTIVRTSMVAIVVINLFLKQVGIDLINVSEGTIASAVEALVEIAAITAGWWYNNSLTENAKKADEFLKKLNDGQEVDVTL